ncbi:hypothetical protein ACOMHN_056755 [Nucella lapillus]
MEQQVDFPTRQKKTLDLILTTHPSLKTRCKALPSVGNSDHDVVLYDTSLRPFRPKPPKRKILLWKKANVHAIRKDMEEYAQTFDIDTSKPDALETAWRGFSERVQKTINKNVPSKTAQGRYSYPWIDTSLRRAIRRKQRAHTKARKTGKKRDQDRYKRLQQEVKDNIKKASHHYLDTVVTDDFKTNSKKLWAYVKSKGQESQGVSPLKNTEGYLKSDNCSKAEILNNQFKSVFTEEDLSHMPDKGDSPYQAMDDITVTEKGVQTLLRNLQPNKATGPDSIPAFILKGQWFKTPYEKGTSIKGRRRISPVEGTFYEGRHLVARSRASPDSDMKWIFVYGGLPVCLVGLIANTISVWVWNGNRKHNSMVLLFQCLGLLDNVFLLASVVQGVLNYTHRLTTGTEDVLFPIIFCSQSLSVHVTLVIGIFRWLAVAKTQTQRSQGMTRRYVMMTCGGVGAWCVALTVTAIVTHEKLHRAHGAVYVAKEVVLQTVGYVLPTLLLMVFSILLLKITCQHQWLQSKQKQRRTTLAVLSIAACSFLACPVAVSGHLVSLFADPESPACGRTCLQVIFGVADVLQMTNSSVNFVFYVVFASKFRPLLRRTLCHCAHRFRSGGHHRGLSRASSAFQVTSDSGSGTHSSNLLHHDHRDQDSLPLTEKKPAAKPAEEPSAEPAEEPTAEPAEEPTAEEPAAEPAEEPAAEPTAETTAEPTAEPAEEPAAEPTAEESRAEPTADSTEEPTKGPLAEPAREFTKVPTVTPAKDDTVVPVTEPTTEPTAEPTKELEEATSCV